MTGGGIPVKRRSGQYLTPEFDDPREHFRQLLPHNDLFSGNKGDERIGRLLDELDQVGVHHQGLVIETSELNHAGRFRVPEGEHTRSLTELSAGKKED